MLTHSVLDSSVEFGLFAEHFNDRADWPMALNINMAARLRSEGEGMKGANLCLRTGNGRTKRYEQTTALA